MFERKYTVEIKEIENSSTIDNELNFNVVERSNNFEKVNVLKQVIRNTIKRFVDIVFGILGIILLIPLTIIIYICRKVLKEDDGPMFYEQLRIGKNGKHFRLYKFRTMVVGADEKLKKYLEKNEEARKEYEENHKLRDDPRITRLGRFLRKTSIDEVPQFWNVLKGDMSLIGPRPIVDAEIPKFGDKIQIIHSIKPGITGYWAVNGRSDTTYQERVQMETYYAENYSLKLDAKIFVKTIEAVIKKEGAI